MGDISPQYRSEAPPGAEPSIAQLLSSLVGDAQTLVRREVDLAKAEITEEIVRVRKGAVMLGAGIGTAVIGGLFLLIGIAEALIAFDILSRWLSYLLIGLIFAIVGVFALMVGIRRFKEVDPIPHETIDSVRKDMSWLSEQSQSGKT
jgi:uncharacterized membrane protein YqjE